MTKLNWTDTFRAYEFGVDRGVLYFGEEAIPWEGLISVQEQPSASDATPLYFDGRVFNLEQEINDYAASVEALTYPYFLEDSVLAMMDARTLVSTVASDSPFGFSYRVMRNDGYVIHLVYNVVATIDSIEHATIDDAMDLQPFVFNFYTTPIDVPQGRPSAHFIFDTTEAPEASVSLVEDLLYGNDVYSPRLPDLSELIAVINSTEGV
jgi:hypothetical protein